MPPSSDGQIRFLVNLQRLLDEDQFVASSKFALLLALADLSVERGDDSGQPMALTTEHLAEKFIHYYRMQPVPLIAWRLPAKVWAVRCLFNHRRIELMAAAGVARIS
jgi:hypothetical protein